MAITKRTEYALRALVEIVEAGSGKPVSRREIAKRQEISEHFLEQIFLPLQKAAIVKSVRGPGGGFIVTKDTQKITVWDVFTAVEKNEYLYDKCFFLCNDVCSIHHKCRVRHIWPEINNTLKESMEKISLNDILNHQPD